MKTEQTETVNNKSVEPKNDKTVIEINNLKKSFGKQDVLKNISLNLYNGENLVVR